MWRWCGIDCRWRWRRRGWRWRRVTTTRLGGEDERMGWWHLPSSVPAPTIPSVQLYIPYHTNGMTCHTRPHHTSIAMHQMYDLWYGMVPAPTIPSVHTISYYTIHHRSICTYHAYHIIPWYTKPNNLFIIHHTSVPVHQMYDQGYGLVPTGTIPYIIM